MSLKRPLTEQDLKNKGFPFECENCGSKPTPEQVMEHHGQCAICGDSVVAYTVDTAALILKLTQKSKT